MTYMLIFVQSVLKVECLLMFFSDTCVGVEVVVVRLVAVLEIHHHLHLLKLLELCHSRCCQACCTNTHTGIIIMTHKHK